MIDAALFRAGSQRRWLGCVGAPVNLNLKGITEMERSMPPSLLVNLSLILLQITIPNWGCQWTVLCLRSRLLMMVLWSRKVFTVELTKA